MAIIKEDNTLKTVPAVALTKSVAKVEIVDSQQLHANDYLNKSVQSDVFESLVKSINDFWLEKSKLRQRG